MEDFLPDALRLLRVASHALWPYQRFVNTVFADLLDVCVIVYLDDILIYSADMASHKKHVREVLW